jgi:hypothetical protein
MFGNLNDAYCGLSKLAGHLYYLEFGELPEYTNVKKSLLKSVQAEYKKQISEFDLFAILENVFCSFNRAINSRNKRKKNSEAFPKDEQFAALWPSKSRCKGSPRKPSTTKNFFISPVRSEIEMSLRKLDILRWLVGKNVGVDVSRPKNVKSEVGDIDLTDDEILRRAKTIYIHLNSAWNSRRDNWKEGFKVTQAGVRRRMCFSRAFATGEWNMWSMCK